MRNLHMTYPTAKICTLKVTLFSGYFHYCVTPTLPILCIRQKKEKKKIESIANTYRVTDIRLILKISASIEE